MERQLRYCLVSYPSVNRCRLRTRVGPTAVQMNVLPCNLSLLSSRRSAGHRMPLGIDPFHPLASPSLDPVVVCTL